MNFKRHPHQAGAAYLLLLLTLTLISLSSLIIIEVAQLRQQRSDEDQLIFIGEEFCRALRSYKLATPPGGKAAPDELGELLADNRSGRTRRHLRQIYLDPFTREPTWKVFRNPEHQGIDAIASFSSRMALRTGVSFENKSSASLSVRYSDWHFCHK